MDREEAIRAAHAAGIDLTLLDENLSLSVKERWTRHDAALGFILKLQEAKKKRDAGLQPTTRKASR
jgi:hypothetical protein